jgi:hypothetical protein
LKAALAGLAARPAADVIDGIEALVAACDPGVRDDVVILAVRAAP